MREETLKRLIERMEHIERFEDTSRSPQHLYSKSGRFIIERRTMSSRSTGEPASPIVLRPHPRFSSFPEHTHDYVELMYVCSGSITHNICNKNITVQAGDIIALGKNTKHSISASSGSDVGVNLIISADLFETILNSIRQDSAIKTKRLESLLDKATDRFRIFNCAQSVEIGNLLENMICSSLLRDGRNDYLQEQSVRILVCYLCMLTDTTDMPPEDSTYTEKMKKKISKYIRTSYSTATLTELAEYLGLSSPYLSRWICANFGVSFKELLMRERFSVACDLLRSTDTPIGEVLVHVGYENSSYFHKEFKKRFGTTPGKYRKQQVT